MQRKLIAFLGAGPYHETTYAVDDKQYRSKVAFMPIFDHFSPVNSLYVIGTRESCWEMLTDFPYNRIEIPYGRNEADFWKMFDILTDKIDIKHSEVIFDITHCFRAIPLFTAIYIRFIRYMEPTAHFSHIFYGSFERDIPVTPVVDLAPVLELLDWIDATNSFIKYGELEELSNKIKTINDRVWKEHSNAKPRTLGEFSKRLRRLANLSRLTYIPLFSETSKELSDLLKDKTFREESLRFLKPFSLLSDTLLRFTDRFTKPLLWETHLEVARWYLENKRPTQALLVLREVILTYLCEKDGCDAYDYKARDQREKKLNEERKVSRDPVVKLWGKVTDARNRVGHALMKRHKKDISVNKAITEVDHLMKETEKVLKLLL